MLRSLALIAIFGGALSAQEFRSTLTGRITDPSAAGVPNATVVIIKMDTRARFQTVSGPEGFYTVPQLLPGAYQLTVEVPGFKQYVQSGIEIAANVRATQNVVLAIGSASETVTVTDDAPPLTMASASAGQSITTREVENLPINGRAPMDLAAMAYAVVNTGNRDQNRPYENSGFSNLGMGGAVAGANEVLLDGVPNLGTLGNATTQNDRRAAFSPPVDSVSEVKVDVLNVDAAYGGSGGGTVQIITKGGTNGLHGSLSEFNQTSNLTATPFFTNASGGKKTVFRQNQWGITAGGPVMLPKLYDGKDKLFWFFTYEGHKNSEPAPTYTTVPTAAERKGDFSELLRLGTNYTIYDPATAVLSGSTVTRQAFPGNIVPQNRINPIATNYLNFIGMPNFAGKADGTNNYFAPLTTNNSYYSFSGRLDFNISNANKLTGGIRQSLWQQRSGDIFSNIAKGEAAYRSLWGANIDDVHTFSPTLIGNLRAGYNRYRAYYDQNSFGYDPTQLGFPSYVASNATRLLMPQFAFSDGFLVASPETNLHYSDQPYNTYQVFGSLTKIKGTHTIKFGGELRVLDFSNFNWSGATGNYTFDNTWVKANSTAAGAPLGGSMAAFLLGQPSSGNLSINATAKSTAKYNVLFLQDDWHLRSDVTLNLGIRYEYIGPTTERWNRMSSGFDMAAINQATAAASAAYAKAPLAQLPASQFIPTGGLLFATDSHRTATEMPTRSFSPRFGLSWTPAALKGRTVFRTGAGIFDYLYGVLLPQQPGFSFTNTYVATNNSYLTPATTLSNPFPNGIQQPPGSSQGVNTFLGQSVTYLNPALERQYSLRWTFDIQHELTKATTIQVGYIGNHSVHLATNYNFGSLPSQYLSRSPLRDNATISALAAVVPNPMAGLLPGTSLNGSTTSVSNILRPFPTFTGVTMQDMTNGGSYFHQVALRFARRMTKGLLFNLNYTHSRLMERVSYLNNGDFALEKRVSSYDRPNTFGASALYQLPFGRGKSFFSDANKVANLLCGDWAMSTMYTYHEGAPLSWGNLIYYGGDLNYNPRAVNRSFDTSRFNLISNQQLSQNYRTFPTLFNNLRLDGTNNINFSVTKDFAIREQMKLQFRTDSFNAFNRALFGGANLTATSAAFSTITNTTNSPRVIQFALVLKF
ncbi:MAG: carboxypeptidase regulatory-like domain-containing protein [Acidobacteria bacterium]|nr:carboxypeptidase regulatory-like domain-containing protein [Acidobacteriota bacterium]